MEIPYYTKHHQAYVNNLNAALDGTEHAATPVDQLIVDIDALPEKFRRLCATTVADT